MKKRMSIVKHFGMWVLISSFLIAIGMYSFFKFNRLSIEFTWGIDTTIEWQHDISEEKLEELLSTYDAAVTVAYDEGDTELLVVPRNLGDEKSADVWNMVNDYLLDNGYIKGDENIKSTSFIWPSIGDYMTKAAKTAIIWGLALMGIYILIVFVWVREYFSPWIFSLVTVITLLHDVIIAAGGFGILMHFDTTIMIDSVFVMAILTVLGYSINDTIVIFDRLRENMMKYNEQIKKGTKDLIDVFDESLYQTIRRSLGTSISTFVVVFVMWMLGTDVLQSFAFVIMIGIIAGTYSSIFIAAPMAYWINKGIQNTSSPKK